MLANPTVLRRLREDAELTQAQVCVDICAQGHYSLIERGLVGTTRRKLRRIADRLNTDVETITALEDEQVSA